MTGEKIGFLLKDAGTEATFPKGAVDMVCHEEKSMYCAVRAFGVLFEPIKVKEVIFFGEEAGLPVIATLDDVQRGSRHYDSWSSWHGEQFTVFNYYCKLRSVP